MRRPFSIAAALCLALFLSTNASSQSSSNASVSGFIQDPSQAFIPGVGITATNTQTGVVSTATTNESGTYTILSLLPGTYRLTAELPGFKSRSLMTFNSGKAQ
jgi:hypothetical protein